MTGLVHILHLGIAQCGDTMGAPVDDTASLVDQTLFIQGDEYLPNSPGAAFIHGESGTIPVAGCAQLLLLLHNAVAVLLFPVPDSLQELFPAKIVAGQTLLAELFLNLDLGCDTGMVNAGNPQGVVALHTLEADQGILQGSVHCVPHVQLTGNIRWRHHNGEGRLALVCFCMEVAALLPHIIDLGFYLLGFVDLG